MGGGSWAGGSTRAWRRTRLGVLRRDGWVCQLCKQPIDRQARAPHPRSASVHHVRGKRYGDDPRYLVAAHLGCNLEVGEPEQHDPAPAPRTDWALTLVAVAQNYLGATRPGRPTSPERSAHPAPSASAASNGR